MKHLLTLLITVVAFTTTYAQSRKIDEAKRVINGESREERRVNGESGSRSSETSTSREAEIDRINREYDRKINSVRRNPILSADQKNRRVRELEIERAARIREVNDQYRGDKRRNDRRSDDDDYSRKNKKYKKDNGKHLGWEKGVGNPHRSGSTKHGGKGKKNK